MTAGAELAAELRPARLPSDMAALGWQDAVAGFGLGLIAAWLLFLLLRPFLRRKARPGEAAVARLRAAAGLPGEERLLQQARVLKDVRPEVEPDWRDALYEPGRTVDHEAIDAQIVALTRRRR